MKIEEAAKILRDSLPLLSYDYADANNVHNIFVVFETNKLTFSEISFLVMFCNANNFSFRIDKSDNCLKVTVK